MKNYYRHPQETWDEKKCRRIARHHVKDGYGNPAPVPGLLSEYRLGCFEYNGGCIREGRHYDGEIFPEPNLPKGFVITHEPCWGLRLIETEEAQ